MYAIPPGTSASRPFVGKIAGPTRSFRWRKLWCRPSPGRGRRLAPRRPLVDDLLGIVYRRGLDAGFAVFSHGLVPCLDANAPILSAQTFIALLQAGRFIEQPTKVGGGNFEVARAIFEQAAEILTAGVVLLGHRTSKFAQRPAGRKTPTKESQA
ncbi:MAG: hypothetical protein ACI9S9_004128 [Planctomycetota bacterium]|jgi:hypothetical protein